MFIYFKKSPTLVLSLVLFTTSIIIFIGSIFLFSKEIIIIIEWILININSSIINLPIILDPQGILFRGVVCFISGNVILFSHIYISREIFISRFIHLVILFIISINLLIFIPRIIFLLLGWDGLGLIRFLLVIYYQNSSSLAAGIITALTNRIGDVLILLRISWTLSQGQWSLVNIQLRYPSTIVIIILIIAAITKRAQIPFSRWLPAAIAAPTPVSALVHSSTLVTAGVFLIFRFYNILTEWKLFNPILFIIGSLTILIAGTRAIVETDIKKIIALSTLRQLGVIIATLGIGMPTLAFFHLITHALFKALLFICAGVLINFHSHRQELRSIGNTLFQIPIIRVTLLAANLALCGAPFIAGFYSKDIIIETILFSPLNFIIYIIFLIATLLTAAYSTRFTIIVIIAPSLSNSINPINDTRIFISISTILLSLGAITIGSIISWFFLYLNPEPFLIIQDKLFALMATVRGIIIGVKLSYYPYSPWIINIKITTRFFSSIWRIKVISTQFILNKPLIIRKNSTQILDQGWYEIYGPQNILKINISYSNTILKIQTLRTLQILILSSVVALWFIF